MSCRVLPGHLQYRAMESRSLKSWEDGSVCKRSLSKLIYLSFDRQRSVSKQGRVVTMTYPTNLPALLQLCGGDSFHLPQVSSAWYMWFA